MLAGAVCLDLPTFASKVSVLGQPNLRIGVLSDIHVENESTQKVFIHALEYFREQDVDGVIMAGDLADHGQESELKMVADAWYKVFPKDTGLKKKHVEKLFVYGNHDIDGHNWVHDRNKEKGMTDAQIEAEAIGMHPDKTWKKLFHEKYAPVWLKNVKGYYFIGGHWHPGNMPGLEEILTANRDKLVSDKPFFYIQHPHPRNSCNGPWVWGMDDGSVTQLLSQYRNAVAFSGHSHSPLNDDRDLWQGAFTSIGTSSLSYLCPKGGRENSVVDGERNKIPAQMPAISTGNCKQGMVMQIYDDCITIERREFVYDQSLGDNWIIPLPLGKDETMTDAYRAKTAKIPQFAKGDAVTVTRAEGKDRYGVVQKQVTVHFPSVLKKRTGVRAFDYEIQVEGRHPQVTDVVKVYLTKRVFSPGSMLGEAQDENEVICVFGEGELPEFQDIRFVVRPCECFGKKGEPIYTEWMPSRS